MARGSARGRAAGRGAEDLVLFRDAALVDATAPVRREGFHVLVEGAVIREVSDRPIKARGARAVDVRGRTLMPGLIDAHVHVIAVTTDLPALARMEPYLLAAQAKGILEGMLARGFTAARDAGGAEWGLAEAVRRGHFQGPRLFVSGLALAQTGGQGDFRARAEHHIGCPVCHNLRSISRVADGVDEVRKAARDELRKGADQVKVMASGGMVSRVPIDRPHFSLAELRAAVEEAEAAKTYVMAHAYESEAVRRCIACGVRSIEHGNLIDRETAELMARQGTYLVPTMTVYEGYHKHGRELGYPRAAVARFKELGREATKALEIAKTAGVRIGHGSDLEGVLHQYQSRELFLKAEVLSAHEVITSATRTNAELMNMAGKLGIIAPGAIADILVVDGNPLRSLAALAGEGRHLSVIMKDGVFHKNTLETG